MNRDDVESAGAVGEMLPHHVLQLEPHDSPLLLRGDRFGRLAECVAVTRLHFDEHQRRSIARNDVQFATATPKAARNNYVPTALQLATREIFAGFSESNAMTRHGRQERSNIHAIITTINAENAEHAEQRILCGLCEFCV